MVNYSNTKIYKIWSLKGDNIYVGATTKQYLSQRMDEHRREYKRWLKGNCKNVTSYILFEEYGLEHCQIELLEAKACESKDEQTKLEGHYIRTLKCINKVIPDRKTLEYLETNREVLNENSKKYREEHQEEINERQRLNRAQNKEILNAKSRQHRAENKDKINEQKRQYYEKNKDVKNAKKREKRAEQKAAGTLELENINEKQRINRLKRIEAKKQTN